MPTASRRLTRKELRQPDWFHRATEAALESYQKNRPLALLAVATLIAILLGFWGFQMFKQSQETAAARDFAQAMNLYQGGKYKEAIGAFEKVQSYRWSRYANFAHLYEANGYLELNDLEKAANAAQRFVVGTKEDTLMRQMGLFTLGNIEERRDRCKEAIQHYAAAERINAPLRDIALLGKARCSEKTGNLPDTIAAYKEYLKGQPNSPVTLRVAELESKLAGQTGAK
ncbi:MAG TPA: tetratricopeptide repeat protein [Candidatus Binatia bacterium]|nr:tetratricopeptide repeat protein [Candidatus Binatia bacterium]